MPALLTCALLAEDAYHDRPTSIQRYSPVRVPDREVYCASNEFAGAAYAGDDRVGVIAFRGTKEMEDWSGANADILLRRLPTAQIGCALAFFALARRTLEMRGCQRHVVVGHSLGGGLAAVVAASVSWAPVRGVTFNAPGLAEFAGARDDGDLGLPRSNAENVFNFRTDADIVSRWGKHIGRIYDVGGTRRHGIRALIDKLATVELGQRDF